MGVRAQATTLVLVATPGVEAAEGAKCPPDTVVESAKWCTEQVNPACQPVVVPRGVPSDGADKGGVSPLLLVEGGLAPMRHFCACCPCSSSLSRHLDPAAPSGCRR